MSPEIAVPFMIFGLPVALVFITKYFRFREKQLEAGSANPRQLNAVRSEYEEKQRELLARVENLESILIDLDSDIEHRVAARKRPAALGPRKPAALPDSGTPLEEDKLPR